MLQAARHASQQASLRNARSGVLAVLGVHQPNFARCASTSVDSEDANAANEDPSVQKTRLQARSWINRVQLFFEHPSKLLEAASLVKGIHSASTTRLTSRLVSVLAANPVVDNRTEVMRELLALPLMPTDAVRATRLQPSHADAIAQLSKVRDGLDKVKGLGIIVRTRYDDAPFVSAKDVISALTLADPRVVCGVYLSTLPQLIHRLELNWEREALARRGTSPDKQQRVAAEQLLVLEDHLGERYPALFDDDDMRRLLLGAHAAAREHARAEQHWRWLLKRPVTAGLPATAGLPSAYLNSRLAVARDFAELAAVWAEARAAYPHIMHGRFIVGKHVESVLYLHCARLGRVGAVHELLDFAPRDPDRPPWVLRAREAEAQGGHAPERVAEAFRQLRAAGLGWDGAAFMLGPSSLIQSRRLEAKPTSVPGAEADSNPSL